MRSTEATRAEHREAIKVFWKCHDLAEVWGNGCDHNELADALKYERKQRNKHSGTVLVIDAFAAGLRRPTTPASSIASWSHGCRDAFLIGAKVSRCIKQQATTGYKQHVRDTIKAATVCRETMHAITAARIDSL